MRGRGVEPDDPKMSSMLLHSPEVSKIQLRFSEFLSSHPYPATM